MAHTGADILVEVLQDWHSGTAGRGTGQGLRRRGGVQRARHGADTCGNVAHLACRTALVRRGVQHITFPVDLQECEITSERSKRSVPGHTSEVLAQSARLPHDADLAQAAEVLNQGKRVLILAGRGALHAGPELEPVA
jgi:pyruvate dehydrogenase (quinone)